MQKSDKKSPEKCAMNLKYAKKDLLNCSLCPIMTNVELRKQQNFHVVGVGTLRLKRGYI